MADETPEFIRVLSAEVNDFAAARDWEPFHSPKNLSMALMVEAAELVEHFQWLSEQQSFDLPPQKRQAVSEELADVLIYLVRLASRLEIDLEQAAWEKLEINKQKYPVEKSRGIAKKYTEL